MVSSRQSMIKPRERTKKSELGPYSICSYQATPLTRFISTPNYSVSAEKVSKRKSNQPLLDLAAPSSSMGVQDVDRRLILPLPKRPRISSGNTIFHPAEVETSNNPPPRFKKRGNAPLSTESMMADHRYSLMQEPSTRDFQRLPIIGPPPAQTSSSNSTNAGGIGTDVGNGPRIIQLRPGKICAVTWGHGDFSVSFQD